MAARPWTCVLTLRGWGLVPKLAHTNLMVSCRVPLCQRILGDGRTVGRGPEVEPMVILTANQVMSMSTNCTLCHLSLLVE